MNRRLDPIIGDLCEEYREVILPGRGPVRGTLWFAGQLASLVQPWMWGVLLGLALGGLNLLSTALAPLAEDTPLSDLALAATILGMWTLVGFGAERRRFRFGDAVRGGITAAFLSAAIFSAGNLARKMMFLDVIQHRSDWHGLLLRFSASGSHDLRSFVLTEHLEGLPGGILFSLVAGALCGAIGGALSQARRERRRGVLY